MTRSRFPMWLAAALLVLVTIALYWPATRHDFVNYDDQVYVTANVHVQDGLTLESIKWAFLNPVCGNWHPLTVLSHMLDCQLFGLNPWGHHLTSVLLHAINTILVFLLLRRLTGALWRSLMVAALFGLHPLHVESVAWVAERKDVLSACFGLLALLFYIRYAQRRSQGADHGSPAASWKLEVGSSMLDVQSSSAINYSLSLFFFACGLMSKPMLVTWPFVMLLLDYWPLRRFQPWTPKAFGASSVPSVKSVPSVAKSLSPPLSQFPPVQNPCSIRVGSVAKSSLPALLFEKIPFFALAAAASVATFVVQEHGGAVMRVQDLPLGARSGNALVSYCRYLGKMFWPTHLAVFYPHPRLGHWPMGEVLLAGGVLLGISVLLIVKRRRYPFLLMGWLWYCGTLVPVIGLAQVGSQAMADRYTYIPSPGVLILAIWGAYELARRWRHHVIALSVAGTATIVLCLVLTRQQMGYWKDSEALFRHALAVTENNHIAHKSLGNVLDKKGQIDEAICQFQEAVRLKPDYADAHNDLGADLGRKGEIDKAISQFQETIRLKPDGADARNNLGAALANKGQFDEAIRQYQEAIRLKPDYAEARNNLGSAFVAKGQIDEAIRQYQEAIRLKPDYAEARNNLGSAFVAKGQIDEAIRQYREAIRLKPDYAEARFNLGTALVNKGKIDEAIRQYREAIRLKPDYVGARFNLGTALVNKGQIDEAIRQYQEVIRLKPDGAEAHYNLGTALVNKGQIDEAAGQYQEAVRLKPDYIDARYNLGLVLGMKGQTDGAIRQFREVLRLKPDDADARNNLRNALIQKGKSDEVVK